MRRIWSATNMSTSPPPTPAANNHAAAALPRGLTLRAEQHFARRRLCGGTVWVIQSRRVSWIATVLNLYLLVNAVRALHRFTPLQVDDYKITSLGNKEACAPRPPSSSKNVNVTSAVEAVLTSSSSEFFARAGVALQTGAAAALRSLKHDIDRTVTEVRHEDDDLASIMRTCRQQLTRAAGVATGLQRAKAAYFDAAYAFVAVALALDCLRWCGCCSALVDTLLGFRSPRIERFRLAYIGLMLGPFAHLSWLLACPLRLPCCIGEPKAQSVLERVGVLGWLAILVSYCLFADAHNHGYFLLRARDHGSCRLLRPTLGIAAAVDEKDKSAGSAV